MLPTTPSSSSSRGVRHILPSPVSLEGHRSQSLAFVCHPPRVASTERSAGLPGRLLSREKWDTALLPLLPSAKRSQQQRGQRQAPLPSLSAGARRAHPKGISRGRGLEMPSGRTAPGNTRCHPGSGCSNGSRAEINSSLAQLPLSTQHMDTKQDTYCIIRPLKSASRVLSSSCDTQCHQRPMALSCLELEYQSNSSYCL